MNEKIFYDDKLNFAIKFIWTPDEQDIDLRPAWVDFQIVEILSYVEGDIYSIEYDTGNGSCKDFSEAYEKNPLCNGFIKWDGCMEIHSFNYHFCGYSTFMQRMMDLIYKGGAFIMGERFEEDLARFSLK